MLYALRYGIMVWYSSIDREQSDDWMKYGQKLPPPQPRFVVELEARQMATYTGTYLFIRPRPIGVSGA